MKNRKLKMEKRAAAEFGVLDPLDYPISDAEKVEIQAAMRKSIAAMERGEGIPAREALEALRIKYKIPRLSKRGKH